MFSFESPQPAQPAANEVHTQLLEHVYAPEVKYAVANSQGDTSNFAAGKVADKMLAQLTDNQMTKAADNGTNGGSKNVAIDSFGAIKHLDLPRGYDLESKGNGNIGGNSEQIYRNKQDADSLIATTLLRAPIVEPEGAAKLQTLLSGSTGPLSDAQRADACSFMAKFSDNQYKPGNSAAGYGDAWKAPAYFVRTMEVREVDGKRMLMVDGAFTPAPWKPTDGLDKAQTRFSAAFMLDGSNVQAVYMEAKPQNYSLQENKFLQSIKKATF